MSLRKAGFCYFTTGGAYANARASPPASRSIAWQKRGELPFFVPLHCRLFLEWLRIRTGCRSQHPFDVLTQLRQPVSALADLAGHPDGVAIGSGRALIAYRRNK